MLRRKSPVTGLVFLGLLIIAALSLLSGIDTHAMTNGTGYPIQRVSVASDGTQGDYDAGYSTAISADGRYVAFVSNADNLVPNDINGAWDVFIHDMTTGETKLVSVASDGTQGKGYFADPSLSANGNVVAFTSDSPNMVAGYTNGYGNIFVHNLTTGVTKIASVSSSGKQGDCYGSYCTGRPALSADGNIVAFESWSSNLAPGDSGQDYDIFVHNMTTGETKMVSISSAGEKGNGWSLAPSLSADGNIVAFGSGASNLVPGDTNNSYDIFIHNMTTGETKRVSVASDGTQGNGHSEAPIISPDGRYIAFESNADNLVPNDINGAWDVFIHDMTTGETKLVSVASDGTQGNDYSGNTAISADGRYVAFKSFARNLVPNDTNWRADVFIHDMTTGETKRVSVASDGTEGNHNSGNTAISADGKYVVFSSDASNLIPNDTNGFTDVFVVDLGSGTATPTPTGTTPTDTPTITPTVTLTPIGCVNAASGQNGNGAPICPGPTVTPVPVESGFDVKKDAWSFRNASYEAQWKLFEDTYGKDKVDDANGNHQQKADNFFKQFIIPSTKGLCEGYSLSAAMLFAQIDGISLPVSGYSDAYHVPAPKMQGGLLEQGSTGDFLARYQIYEWGWQYVTAAGEAKKLSFSQQTAKVISSIDGGLKDPAILVLDQIPGSYLQCTAHAVLPYAYTKISEGRYDVKIYDPNYPGQEKIIKMDSGKGGWAYDSWSSAGKCLASWSWWPPEGKLEASNFYVIPVSQISGKPEPLWEHFASQSQGSLLNVASARVSGEGLNPIYPDLQANSLVPTSQSFVVTDTQKVSVTLHYTDSEESSTSLFADGKYMGLTTDSTISNTNDNVMFDLVDQAVQVHAGTVMTREIQTITPNGDADQEHVLSCRLPANSLSRMGQRDSTIVVSSDSKLEGCIFALQQESKDKLTYALPTIEAADTITIQQALDGSNVVKISIDHDSDGTTDKQQTLKPVGATFSLFLPLIRR